MYIVASSTYTHSLVAEDLSIDEVMIAGMSIRDTKENARTIQVNLYVRPALIVRKLQAHHVIRYLSGPDRSFGLSTRPRFLQTLVVCNCNQYNLLSAPYR